MNADRTHLVLIPAFNPGPRLAATVGEALAAWNPVWVVSDGSTDGSERALAESRPPAAGVRLIRRERNGGKGAAVLTGAREALQAGFSHALVMDADGQHPADRIGAFMEASRRAPGALILGRPEFGEEAPWIRCQGRKLSIGLVRAEILGAGIDDPLFGFRVYPLAALVRALESTGGARRYDFDPEIAVRLAWAGVPVANLGARCRYFSAAEGGVSHFHYIRDNLRMVWLHTRLLTELILFRWPAALRARRLRLADSCS